MIGGRHDEKNGNWGLWLLYKKCIYNDRISFESVGAFCDSDLSKQGTTFLGKRVISPEAIPEEYSTIVIGSQDYYEEIYLRAKELDPDKKIVNISEFDNVQAEIRRNGLTWNGNYLKECLNQFGPIKQELLKDAKICTNREEPLYHMGKGLTVGEIGVAYGDFSKKMLDILKPNLFYAIDFFNKDNPYISFWGRTDFEDTGLTHEEWYRKRFLRQIETGQMQVLAGLSWDCLEK